MILNLIFDIDGTVYSFRTTGIGKQMRARINEFLVDEFKMTDAEADAFAQQMYDKYGLTARGLQVEKKIPAVTIRKFAGYTHMIDYECMAYSAPMVEAFTKLASAPGVRLWALTNATKQHAAATMAQLGISNAFRCPDSGVLRIIDCFQQWEKSPQHTAECKPLRVSYELTAQLARVTPDDTFVMVEDALRNLDEPKAMGWKTVFIHDQRAELAAHAKALGHVVAENVMEAMPYFFELASKASEPAAAIKKE